MTSTWTAHLTNLTFIATGAYKHSPDLHYVMRLVRLKQALTCWLMAARARMRHVLTSCARKLPNEAERCVRNAPRNWLTSLSARRCTSGYKLSGHQQKSTEVCGHQH